jgi:hypothetical protein
MSYDDRYGEWILGSAIETNQATANATGVEIKVE